MQPRLAIVILAMFAVLALSLAAQTNHPSAETSSRIAPLVSRYSQLGYLNGAVLVARHGTVLYSNGIGYANFASRTPNTPQTKFGIASLTKQFTAVLILQQIADGKIKLDGKLSDYLPWYRKDTASRITIEQLLHHTAGLPPHTEPLAFAQKSCQPDLGAQPGTQWNYSNCGYDLLGLVLEQVTGKPFSVLLQERLLDPLGMKNSGMDNNDLVQRGGATGYVRHAGARYSAGPYLDHAHIYSAGAMYSTVEDLLLWNQALSEGGAIPQRNSRPAL